MRESLPPPSRRSAIMEAALPLFLVRGVAATSTDDIRRGSDCSVGSFYHWFRSKAAVAAAIYLEALQEVSQQALADFLSDRPAEQTIRTAVENYLAWVKANPDKATFLLHCREPEVVAISGDQAAAVNQVLLGGLTSWLVIKAKAGEVRPLDTAVFMAVCTGPSQEFARMWLATARDSTTLTKAASALGHAAVRSLCVARTGQPPQ